MLFRKHIDPHCGYCRFSAPADNGCVICRKKGIVSETEACRHFRYNPLRRTPPRPLTVDFSQYDSQDYSL